MRPNSFIFCAENFVHTDSFQRFESKIIQIIFILLFLTIKAHFLNLLILVIWFRTLLQKQPIPYGLQNRCPEKFRIFSCEICEIFKNTFSTDHLWWLLLIIPFLESLPSQQLQKQVFQVFRSPG